MPTPVVLTGLKVLRSTALGHPGSALGAENGQDPSGGGLQISQYVISKVARLRESSTIIRELHP